MDNYGVLIKLPSEDKTNLQQCCFCELHSHVTREYVWFGSRTVNLSLRLVDDRHPVPMNRHDAELTAQIAYLTFRYLNPVIELVALNEPDDETAA